MLYLSPSCRIRRDHGEEYRVNGSEGSFGVHGRDIIGIFGRIKRYQAERQRLFRVRRKNAYTECLEMIQLWKNAKQVGLDFEIEKKFPL